MANAGNESDLSVVITVDSRKVKSGFEEILSDARSFKSQVQSILGNMDFSRVFDYSSEMKKAIADAQRKLDEVPLSIKVALPKGKSIGTTISGEMDKFNEKLEQFRQRYEKARSEIENSFDPQEKKAERKNEVQRRHNEAIREYISLLRQLRQLEGRMGMASYMAGKNPDGPLGEAYSSEYAALASMRDRVQSRLSAVSAKYGGAKWFDASEARVMADLSDRVAKSEQEAAIEARKMADAKREQAEAQKDLAKSYVAYRIILRLVSRLVGVMRSAVAVSDELYQSQLKLAAAMKVNSEVTNSQVRGMFAYVKALSQANGLSIEANYGAAQILSSYVDTEESLRKLLAAYDDLVIKMKGYGVNSQQATTIAKQLARALAGDTNALSKYGFVLSDVEKKALRSNLLTNAQKVDIVVNAIRRKTGDISRESETWAGMVNRVKVNATLIKANLGMAVQNALYPMLKIFLWISQVVEHVSEGLVELSRFVFGNNIKGAEELAGWLSDVDDELSSIQSRLLSFDKFNVLGGDNSIISAISGKDGGDGSGGGGEGSSERDESDNEPWREWLELIGNITGAAELLKIAIVGITTAVGALMALALAKKIKDLISSLGLLKGGISGIKSGLGAVLGGITLLISGILTLTEGISQLQNWDELTGAQRATAIIKVIAGSLMTLVGVVILAKVAFDKLSVAMVKHALNAATSAKANATLGMSLKGVAAGIAGITVGIGALVMGLSSFLSNFGKMDNVARALIPTLAALAAAFVGVAVAKAAAEAGIAAPAMAGITAAALTAGIALAVGSTIATIGKYENGGLPDRGQLFIANEGGPELIGNIGGRTSVANNSMITEAIEQAAYRGFSRATAEGGANSVTLTLQGDAVRNDALVRALMPALKTEVRRQGGPKKAFGGD